jgi:hypothetical protein
MTIRIAAIEVSHWHAVYDAAYLRHLIVMPDVEPVPIQDSDADVAAKRAAEVKNPPIFTDYRKMLATTHPDFVVALGRHRQMAGIARVLLTCGTAVTPSSVETDSRSCRTQRARLNPSDRLHLAVLPHPPQPRPILLKPFLKPRRKVIRATMS